jgi:UDP-N-acetylmuramoyl-L-alanyl-D-glutamate--2,6-diaminopimelate ligase
LYRLHLENCDAVCIEASSHGLDQGRLNGTAIDMAVFTNITRDHLDYHFSFNAYLQAKKILFRWRGLQVAVINLDDEYATEFIEAVPGSTRVLTFSLRDDRADIHCDALLLRADGFDAEVVTPWGTGSLSSSLLGEFNVSNMLVTLTVLGLLEYDLTQSLARLGEIQTVPGRMDALSAAGFATVVIDYAHTPDALEKALKALRDHCKGELWCVVGCGGDRDAGKRPLMGRIASTVADRLILTSDNPRGEHPQKIINDILQGIDRETVTLTVESDRRRAIRMAVGQAVAGDIVLVAGKGHEDYQEVGQRRIPYSDYDEVRAAFGEVSGRS